MDKHDTYTCWSCCSQRIAEIQKYEFGGDGYIWNGAYYYDYKKAQTAWIEAHPNCVKRTDVKNTGGKMKFAKGDKIRVSYEGTVSATFPNGNLDVSDDMGYLHVYKTRIAEGFERITPKYELGDLWQVPSGSAYVVRKTSGNIYVYGIVNSLVYTPEDFFRSYPHAELIFRLDNPPK